MSSGKRFERSLYVPGCALMPEDFGQRLKRLKELLGLTWEGMATCIGVDYRQLVRWRKTGAVPTGGALMALAVLAAQVPEGLGILLGIDIIVVWRERVLGPWDASRWSTGWSRPNFPRTFPSGLRLSGKPPVCPEGSWQGDSVPTCAC